MSEFPYTNHHHGHASGGKLSKEYAAWVSAKQRCFSVKSKPYRNYGGRGIKMCDGWKRSFETFLSDMGMAPVGTSLDRINNNGNYEPGNCRWATRTEQANNKRTNRVLNYGGQSKTVKEWAMRFGIQATTVIKRLNRGWTVKKALETPIPK